MGGIPYCIVLAILRHGVSDLLDALTIMINKDEIVRGRNRIEIKGKIYREIRQVIVVSIICSKVWMVR